MQVCALKMKLATRWSDADDDEDTALPRIPWQTAAGSAWPCIHGRVSPLRTLLMFVRVPSRVDDQIPLGVCPGAAGGLVYAGVQVQVLALGVAPTLP